MIATLVRLAALAACSPALVAQQGSAIAQTRHNLSITGPGPFRATSEARICVFCHAPHRSRLQVPLWNREDSTTSYLTYQSSTFQGNVGQPNGTTKLCLSCHDGTVALGRVVSRSQEIPMAGSRFLDSGAGFLGANLQDDHPVSFHYASSKAGTGLDYKPAAAIPPPVHLDDNGLVQCTSCHDPHNNALGYFLHRTDQQSEICLSCHDPKDWVGSAHEVSPATWNNQGADPWPHARYLTVRDNACANCHRDHGAGHPERLLNHAIEEDNCLRCHNGNVALKNIEADLGKPSAHSPTATYGVHDPTEDPLTMSRHAECVDCHHSHKVRRGTAPAPNVPGPLHGIDGINSSGTPVRPITYGFELCYKCHSDRHGGTVYVPRVLQQANTRLEFDQANPSFHPIEAPGRNSDSPSLLPPWTTASRMACTDCHAGDSSPEFGGNGARGPHGSIYRPLLGARYTTTDGTPESSTEYALCYKCHSRSSILGDVSFKEHRKHIVEERTPCSVCHDPHGISATQGNPLNNSHLINFDRSVVLPSRDVPGVLRFEDRGLRRGSCTLLCHGEDHNDEDY